jgi:transposase
MSPHHTRRGGAEGATMSEPGVLVGIEVSKAQLDVALRPTDDHWHVSHDEPGMAILVERLQAIRPALIVLEATGGLEVPGAGALAAAALPGVVGHPRHARDCAQAPGRLATTDTLDARGLAHVAAAVRPTPRPLPGAEAPALRALVTRRRPLGPRRTAERQRLQSAPQRIRADSRAHIAGLERRLARRDDDVAAASRSSPLWRVTAEIVQRTPGVGPVRSRTWVAEVPAWGALSRQEIAALAGVAPFTRERGTLRGQRSIWGGRAHVRAVLYMSTLTAVRHHAVLKTFYERLRAAGKAAKVALTARMRKLLTIVNAMVKHRTRWQEKTAETS